MPPPLSRHPVACSRCSVPFSSPLPSLRSRAADLSRRPPKRAGAIEPSVNDTGALHIGDRQVRHEEIADRPA